MKNGFYNILDDILTKKSGGTLCDVYSFKSTFSPFMLARYLSMRVDLVKFSEIINMLNSGSGLSSEQIYKWAYKNIPKQKFPFIKYISKKKKDKKNKNEEIDEEDEEN